LAIPVIAQTPGTIVARQIDQVCAPPLMSAVMALAAPNGGYHVPAWRGRRHVP